MPEAIVPPPAASDTGELQRFLLYLGSALTAAGEAVNEIQARLQGVAAAYGVPAARIVVVPTFVVISLDPTQPTTIEPTRQLRGVLRLDQTAAIYAILGQAEAAEVQPREGSEALLRAVAMPSRFNGAVTVAGHALLTVGICLILQPTWPDVVLAAGFGVLVGVLRLLGRRSIRAQMLMPVVAAFVVSSITLVLAESGFGSADLRAMIAPLVTFLPGAALTTAVVELTAADWIAGASRLVYGALQLVLLAFGIVAGATAFGAPPGSLANIPEDLIGWWAPWLGVLVFGIGVYIYDSAPRRSFGWLMIVLAAAWTSQYLGDRAFGSLVGSFIGALVMTATARAVERFPHAPPALVSFLPGFWLLVPGALGLIGVTEYLSSDPSAGAGDFVNTVMTIVAVALGVLCGYPLVGTVADRLHRIGWDWPSGRSGS